MFAGCLRLCVPPLVLIAGRELGASRLFAVTLVAFYAAVLLAARPTLAATGRSRRHMRPESPLGVATGSR